MVLAAVALGAGSVTAMQQVGPAGLVLLGPAVVLPALAALAERRWGDQADIRQIDLLSRAEVALAEAPNVKVAARQLGDYALELLEAKAATVLIDHDRGQVRITAGTGGDVYADGSRMRLLEVDGSPRGSIAVSARADGAAYSERDERVLDALADRVSATLHRLALFEDVQAERRTLADVLSSSSDGIFSVGPDNQVRSWNPAMVTITGLAEANAIGQPPSTVFRPYDDEGKPRFGAHCPGKVRAAVTELDLRVTATSGDDRWLSCSYSPMADGGFVVVARDVTARKQIDEMKADFLATISHELRTPLTPIQGFLKTLQRRDDSFSTDDRQKVYEVMLRESERLGRLIKDLLEATSIEHIDGLFLPEVVDWGISVQQCVDEFRRQHPDRQVDLRIRPGLPEVVADEQRAVQILTNLLSNAARYSPAGTPVEIDVASIRGQVATRVCDHGDGVADADRDRIFERFVRLGSHMTRPQGGVGLGLYIARRLALGMHGTLTVGRAPGGGAAFTFTLPVHDPAAAATAQSTAKP